MEFFGLWFTTYRPGRNKAEGYEDGTMSAATALAPIRTLSPVPGKRLYDGQTTQGQ